MKVFGDTSMSAPGEIPAMTATRSILSQVELMLGGKNRLSGVIFLW